MTVRLLAVARQLVALVLTASCLITFAPFLTTSSNASGTMACCAGKAGHEGGSCPSGLLGSSNHKEHQASGHSEEPTDSVFEVSAGIHAQPSEPSSPGQEHERAGQDDGSVRIASIARDCAGECGACSTSFNRQPRPREQSTLATKARPHLQTSSHLCDDLSPLCKALQSVTTQLRPRAPPPPSA